MDDRQAHVESKIADLALKNWKLASANASYLRWQAAFKPEKRLEAQQATDEANALREKARRAADEAAKAKRLACFRGLRQEQATRPEPLSQLQRALKPPPRKIEEE
jgi:hypothetical protein